ncbi:MAG: hypothetical protein WCH34_09765 [Bacteroidota bacterium]
MQINTYNKDFSKLGNDSDSKCLPYCLLIGDKVVYDNRTACVLKQYVDLDYYPEHVLFRIARLMFPNDEIGMRGVDELEKSLVVVKKIRQQKHRDKRSILFMQNFNKVMKTVKKGIKEKFEVNMAARGFLQLVPYIEKEILSLIAIIFFDVENSENSFIPEISNCLIGSENTLMLDESMEQLFSFSVPSQQANDHYSFLKIPLWHFPSTKDLSFEEFDYTRENLKTALAPFKIQLKEVSDKIKSLAWGDGNIAQIEQMCEPLINSQNTVQQAIDESLYMIKSKNQFPDKSGVSFNLGVSSVETIIDYYERSEIVLAYEANQIKEQVSRHIDLKTSYVFAYFSLPASNDASQPNELYNFFNNKTLS